MTLTEIKSALADGKEVRWSNDGYRVHCTSGQYLITFTPNGNTIGLTWTDGVTLNGKEEDFYILGEC